MGIFGLEKALYLAISLYLYEACLKWLINLWWKKQNRFWGKLSMMVNLMQAVKNNLQTKCIILQKIISDILINIIYPRRPVKSYMWPTRKDQCWIVVPLAHILCHVTPPSTTCTTSSGRGRQYKLEHANVTNSLYSFNKFREQYCWNLNCLSWDNI